MKIAGIIGTAVLSLTLGAAAPVYAQEERPQQEEHGQQEEKKAQPEKPAQEQKQAQQEEKKAQQEKPAAQHEQPQHASGYSGRIPEDRFHANFGREHVFVINRPVIVEGQPRFQYGGYWFGFSQPWPVGWLYTDNVYVDYVDGEYFLYNPFHPGIRIVIIVI